MLKKLHLQRGDRSQNEVSKTSVTQIFFVGPQESVQEQGWVGGGVCFHTATGYVEKHRAVTHSAHTLCFSALCVFVF